MTDATQATVRLVQRHRYRFDAVMDRPEWTIAVDEPPPLGDGQGPNAARLLATAVGHCLSASLLFCLERARVPEAQIATTVTATVQRNARGRWRIARLTVALTVAGLDGAHLAALERCRGLFEDYCTVTESVRAGIPVDVTVREATSPVSAGEPAS
ncbi:MAG: OsmC family protein [Firmicutes bacterium]|nr:OsmC family protein [Bacillota bacterium]